MAVPNLLSYLSICCYFVWGWITPCSRSLLREHYKQQHVAILQYTVNSNVPHRTAHYIIGSVWSNIGSYELDLIFSIFQVCIHILEMLFIGDHELHPNAVKVRWRVLFINLKSLCKLSYGIIQGYSLRKDYRSYANWNDNIQSKSWWALNEEQAVSVFMYSSYQILQYRIMAYAIL